MYMYICICMCVCVYIIKLTTRRVGRNFLIIDELQIFKERARAIKKNKTEILDGYELPSINVISSTVHFLIVRRV